MSRPVDPDHQITSVLERLEVPHHRPGFWEELTRQMETSPNGPRVVQAQRRLPGGRIALIAAAGVLAVAGALALLLGPDGRSQIVDTNPASEPDADPDDAPVRRSRAELVNAGFSQIRGDNTGWFFSDNIIWTDGAFVALPSGGETHHWSSPDGITWTRHGGDSPVLPARHRCPEGFTCDVTPEAPVIPFFFSEPSFRVAARVGDVVLLDVSVSYHISRDRFTASGEQMATPLLHPDLLAAAAATDPCFRQLQRDQAQPVNHDSVHLASWGSEGLPYPRVSLTCTRGEEAATFTLPLGDHLDEAQLDALFGGVQELWRASLGEPPVRVDDPPTSSFWSDGVEGGDLVTSIATVTSSGDRFWTLDEGTLVTSTDGATWTAHDVPTGGLYVDHVLASPGGHVAVRLVPEHRLASKSARFAVSHDNGATWSPPVEAAGWMSSVGPAGLALLDDTGDSGGKLPVVLIDGGQPRTINNINYPNPGVVVGGDRVLTRSAVPPPGVQTDQTDDVWLFEVRATDGTLLHRHTYVDGDDGGWPPSVPFFLLVLAGVTTVGVFAWWGRRTAGELAS